MKITLVAKGCSNGKKEAFTHVRAKRRQGGDLPNDHGRKKRGGIIKKGGSSHDRGANRPDKGRHLMEKAERGPQNNYLTLAISELMRQSLKMGSQKRAQLSRLLLLGSNYRRGRESTDRPGRQASQGGMDRVYVVRKGGRRL